MIKLTIPSNNERRYVNPDLIAMIEPPREALNKAGAFLTLSGLEREIVAVKETPEQVIALIDAYYSED